ncbi:TPA: LysR family transcriptional regulator [Photobacterium damselae]
MQFSIEQLEAFVAAAETGSFSAGARKLNKAQSVISTAVANLELDLNVTLFDRTTRKPQLTEHGRTLLVKAKRILSQCQQLVANADELQQGVESKLTIALQSMTMSQPLTQALAKFEQDYPFVEIEILNATEDEIVSLLNSGRAQIGALLQLDTLPQEIEAHGIGSLAMVCIVAPSHQLARKSQIDWPDLITHRQIVLSGRHHQHKRWQVSNSIWSTESAISAVNLVMGGIGWTVVPLDMVKDLIAANVLTRLPLSFEGQTWHQGVDIVWTRLHPAGPAARQLRLYLTEARLS